MTNDERSPKPECRRALWCAIADFVIRISEFLRISSFVIRIWVAVAVAVQSHLRDGGIPSPSGFPLFMNNRVAWNIPIFTKLGLFSAMARRLHRG